VGPVPSLGLEVTPGHSATESATGSKQNDALACDSATPEHCEEADGCPRAPFIRYIYEFSCTIPAVSIGGAALRCLCSLQAFAVFLLPPAARLRSTAAFGSSFGRRCVPRGATGQGSVSTATQSSTVESQPP
jgi:hypothetical protein